MRTNSECVKKFIYFRHITRAELIMCRSYLIPAESCQLFASIILYHHLLDSTIYNDDAEHRSEQHQSNL